MTEYFYDRVHDETQGGKEKVSDTVRRVRQKKFVQKIKALDNGCMGLSINRVWCDDEKPTTADS